jgi:hypothetical protein
MEMVLIAALSLILIGVALSVRRLAQQRHCPSMKPLPAAQVAPTREVQRAPPRIETLADMAADFAWKNNQTVFVVVNHARTLAVTVGPPGGRA